MYPIGNRHQNYRQGYTRARFASPDQRNTRLRMNYNSPGSRLPLLDPKPVRPMHGNSSPWLNQAQPGMQMATLPPQPGYAARKATLPRRRTPGRPAPPFIGPREPGLMDQVYIDEGAQRALNREAEKGRSGIYGTPMPPPAMPTPPPMMPPRRRPRLPMVNDIDTLLPPLGRDADFQGPVRDYDQRLTPYDMPRIPYQQRPLNPFMYT
jgi:hypothetical protein